MGSAMILLFKITADKRCNVTLKKIYRRVNAPMSRNIQINDNYILFLNEMLILL